MENSNLIKNTFELHPFFFGIFTTIFIFAFNIHIVKFQDLTLPFLIIIGTIVALTIPIKFVLKNSKKTAFIITISLIIFFSYGHFYDIIESQMDSLSHKILLPIFLIPFLIGIIYFIKTKRKLDSATKIVNGVGFVIILISVINIGVYFIDTESNNTINEINDEQGIGNSIHENKNYPDVYYIILDGYAGSESLKKTFEFDNEEFTNFLNSNNFFVPQHSHSNYPHSYQSLASSLNMNYINEIESEDLQKRTDVAYQMIDNNLVMKNFKAKGFKVINVFSGWGPTRDISLADLNVCNEYSGILNSEFFSMVINKSILDPFYVKIFENDRKELLFCHFEKIKNMHDISEKPIFAFAHITIPHGPYIFGANGESITPESLQLGENVVDLGNNEVNKAGYLGQLKFTNKLATDMIENILSKYDQPPIIVIQGDHGSGEVRGWNKLEKEGLQERHSNFVAILVPNSNKGIFYETITPVNIFRIILNNYFGETLPLLDDKMYGMGIDPPWEFVDVTEIVLKRT